MTVLLYILGVLVFAFAILASIGLHELGHLVPARKFGCRVTQYFVGFGPTVWSRQVGETECGLKAFPLGGYVKIVGMLPPGAAALADEVEVDEDGNQVVKVRRSNTGMFTQLISDARSAEWELVRPEDSDRLFYKLPWWKKVVVMSGGPMVNLVLAFLGFWLLFGVWGMQSVQVDPGQPVVAAVSKCVLPWDAEDTSTCGADDPVAPAYDAGLRPGDVITSFNGTQITDWEQLRELIRDNSDGEAVIGFERGGKAMEGTTSTTVQARPTSAEDQTVSQVGFLGVEPRSHVVTTTGGPIFTLQQMGDMTVHTVKSLGTLPVKVWHVGRAIVGLEERDPYGPMSVVGGGRLTGEVAASDQIQSGDKVAFAISLIAGFNLFIGLFNFVPLLPLDGGHIAGALWEGLRRGLARIFRRPDPGYVDVAKLLPVAYVMALAMLVMGVVLIVGDLVVPIAGPV